MDRDNLQGRVKQIIARRLGLDLNAVAEDARFMEDLGADSVDVVELLMDFQEAFGVTIPDAEAEGLNRFNLVLEYLAAKLGL